MQWLSFPSPRSSAPEPVKYVGRSSDMRHTEYGPLAFGISGFCLSPDEPNENDVISFVSFGDMCKDRCCRRYGTDMLTASLIPLSLDCHLPVYAAWAIFLLRNTRGGSAQTCGRRVVSASCRLRGCVLCQSCLGKTTDASASLLLQTTPTSFKALR